jgi:hypothetical protein
MNRQRKRFGRAAAAAGAILLVAMLAPAASAASSTPARFVYEQCDSALPGGGAPAYTFTSEGFFAANQNCAVPGGWIGIVETQPASAKLGIMGVSVGETPGGFVESETISAVGNLPGATAPSHVYEEGFPGPVGEAQRIFHVRSARDPFWSNGGSFAIVMSCDGNLGPCPGAGPFVGARYIAATEVDPNAPTLSGIHGTLLSGGVVRGHQTLAAEAHDQGGGLSNLTLLVNGLPAAAPDQGNCSVVQVANQSVYGMVAASPTPCPAELKTSWTVDTQAYPFHDGANSVQVCASDYASLGNPNTTCSAPAPITVDNSCTESPVPGGEALSAQFARTEKETITVGYGKGAEVTGELHDSAGDPIAGATICVKSQTLGLQKEPLPVSTVTTDAAGHFAYLVPAGPDREILVGYRHDSAQVARDVRYYAHAAPSLHANPPKLRDGSRVALWGKLPRPSAGKRVVILQAGVVGSKRWITFRRASTDRHGDFRSGYRFHSTTRTTDYRFRAVVPEQDHYPFVEGHSKPVKVLVRG